MKNRKENRKENRIVNSLPENHIDIRSLKMGDVFLYNYYSESVSGSFREELFLAVMVVGYREGMGAQASEPKFAELKAFGTSVTDNDVQVSRGQEDFFQVQEVIYNINEQFKITNPEYSL